MDKLYYQSDIDFYRSSSIFKENELLLIQIKEKYGDSEMRTILTLIFASIILCYFTYTQFIARMGIPLTIDEGKTVEGIFNSSAIFLADQLFRNKAQLIDKTIIITILQNFEGLNEINPLGKLISGVLIDKIHVKNFKVIDYRHNEKLRITESGEIALSRDTKKIKEEFKVRYILTGTCNLLNNGYFINERIKRIIGSTNSEVISIAEKWMPLNLFPIQEISKPVKPVPGAFQ